MSFLTTASSTHAAEARLEVLEREVKRTSRCLRVTWSLAGTAALAALVLGSNQESLAQGYGTTLAQLLNRVISLETRTASISAITDENTGKPTVRFEGVNVQIVSGSGKTDGSINGVGNLIVGYNEKSGLSSDIRTGSHNLVVGVQNNYSNFGGLVVGRANNISGPFASINGGSNNTASGRESAIAGGAANEARGQTTSVGGGIFNIASGGSATVSGGSFNMASGNLSVVSGGAGNEAAGQDSVVSGGKLREAVGDSNWVAGGLFQSF